MSRPQGNYVLLVSAALLALCPDLVLSTSSMPLTTSLERDLHTSQTWLLVATGLSNAAFATAVVVAAQLAQRRVMRPLVLGYLAALVFASAAAAVSSSLPLFLAARVVQGGMTGLLMISVLPPLITRFGAGRLSLTAALVNLGLFGASTAGPIIGGMAAAGHGWRTLMWCVTGAVVVAFAVAWLAFPRTDPVDPDLPVDRDALLLTSVGAVLVFLASSLVASVSAESVWFWLPFGCGLLALVTLIWRERRLERPLMPVREVSTQVPVTGTLVAMTAGAAFVTAVELLQLYLADVTKTQPSRAPALFWTMPLGLVVATTLFGALFSTRFVPVLIDLGLVVLGVGCLLALHAASSHSTDLQVAVAMLGFGAGATVAPGLFLAGLGVRSTRIGRAFALVQLLRLTTTYAVGPVVLYIAQTSSTLDVGVRIGLWLATGIVALGLVTALVIPALSGARLHPPDLEGWLERGERGLSSPATVTHARPGVEDEEAHDLVPRTFRRRR
jgi:MFS family permease